MYANYWICRIAWNIFCVGIQHRIIVSYLISISVKLQLTFANNSATDSFNIHTTDLEGIATSMVFAMEMITKQFQPCKQNKAVPLFNQNLLVWSLIVLAWSLIVLKYLFILCSLNSYLSIFMLFQDFFQIRKGDGDKCSYYILDT